MNLDLISCAWFYFKVNDYGSFQVNLDGWTDFVAEITELFKRSPEGCQLCVNLKCNFKLSEAGLDL